MERMKSGERFTILILQRNVEYCSIINLLNILEASQQCCDNMLC
jgi:hypothetical protein